MSRLTKRTAVGYRPMNMSNNDYCIDDCIQKLGKLEDLEEQGRLIEQKHGRWIHKDNFIGKYLMCSECSHVTGMKSNYCHHCGAKMDEVE